MILQCPVCGYGNETGELLKIEHDQTDTFRWCPCGCIWQLETGEVVVLIQLQPRVTEQDMAQAKAKVIQGWWRQGPRPD